MSEETVWTFIAVDEVTPVMEEITASVESMAAAVDAAAASIAETSAGIAESMTAASEAIASVGESSTASAGEISGLSAAMAEVSASTSEGAAALGEVGIAADATGGSLAGLGAAVAEVDASMATVAGAAGDAALALDTEAASAEAAGTATASAATEFAGAGITIEGVAASISGAAGLITLATGAIAAVFTGVGVKAAGDFQSALTALATGAGESESNLKMVGDGIQQMAIETGTGLKQLTDGMYMIESSGIHGADGLKVLQAAAEGAKVGSADLGTVANALTTVLTDYHQPASMAAADTSALIATVASGKTHLQDLASALGAVLPVASHLGVTFPQVAGAIATMTNAGVPAQQAAQELAHVLLALSAPSATAVKSMKEVGLTSQQVADALRTGGLTEAIKLIEEHVGKTFPANSVASVTAFKNIMGGVMGTKVAADLGGKSMKDFEGNVNTISKAMNKGKGDVQGWSLVQGDFNQKMEKAGAALEVAAVKIGEKLLPPIGKLLDKVTPLIGKFADWITSSQGLQKTMSDWAPVIGGVAAIVGGILVAAFVSWAIAAGAAAIATIAATWPILLIIVGIGLLVAIIILLVQHWGEVTKFLQSAWQAFSSWFMGALGSIGSFFTGIWNGIKSTAVSVWNGIVSTAKSIWNGIISFFKGIWDGIVSIFQGAIKTVVGWFEWLYNHNYYFKDLVDGIVKVFTTVKDWLIQTWTSIVGWIETKWQYLKNMAEVYFNYVYVVIEGKILQVEAFLHKILVAIGDFILQKWNAIVTFTTDLWTKISTVFSNAWNTYIAGPINKIWTAISNWFNNLITTAEKWGVNMMQGFINGILSMLNNIGQAASQVGQQIAKFLGFHSPPPEGILADADQWMPRFATMLSTGLDQSGAKLQASAQNAASIMAGINPTASISGSLASGVGGGSNVNTQMLAELQAIRQAVQQGQGGGSTVTQNIGPNHFPGVANPQQLYNLLNQMSGFAFENGLRGAGQGLSL